MIIKSPLTFKEFTKNPVAGVAFAMLLVVSYLYLDQKTTTNEIIAELRQERAIQAVKIDKLTCQLKRTDSALAVAVTELRVLSKVGKL
jgi:hypothetical protein